MHKFALYNDTMHIIVGQGLNTFGYLFKIPHFVKILYYRMLTQYTIIFLDVFYLNFFS